jgi:autotransporter passenger strand-loop-strand repeat protein
VLSGGIEYVSSGGVAVQTAITAGGSATVLSGGVLSAPTLAAGGVLIDGGRVLLSGDQTVRGALKGAGVVAQTAAGDLVLSGSGSGFAGQAVISAGRIELAGFQAIGTGSVVFSAGVGLETLQIDSADAPAAGGTFANVISNFSAANDYIDLRSIAFVAGASATVSGKTLTLVDGGKTYKFTLAGSIGSKFPVLSDGHGGTLIDPHVARFAQATAGFSAPAASTLSPTFSGGTSAYAALLSPTGSPTDGRGTKPENQT